MRTEESFAGISVPPGDPAGVQSITNSFSSVASNLRSTASRLRSSPSEMPSWQGVASMAYAGLCLIAGEDADAAAERMEHAAAAATKYKDELTDARRDAREAIAEARDAKDLIDQAKQQIADAKQRLADAQSAMTTASNDMTASASSGVPPLGAQTAFDQASRSAGAAEDDIAQATKALERAEEDLERAQQRGRRATERAKDSATMLKAALMAASPSAIGLAVGAPATAQGASGATFTGLSAEQVATFFRRVGPEGGARLAQTHPELVGPLDGAPLELRYEANTALAGREVQRLESELAGVESELEEEGDGGGFGFPPLVSTLPIIAGREIVERLTTSRREELEGERDALEGKLGNARAFADPNRNLLIYDPRGDGRVAEVFGDLEHAKHATVLVPGIGNSMDGFDGEFRGEVQNLHNEASARSGGEAATVAWLGYDSPDGFTDPATFSNDSAADGGESLARSVDGINAQNPGAHTTVAGHSYGSVVTGNAAAHHGLNADDVVLTGSPGPGPGVDHASDLSRGGEARVWSAAAPDDLVASPPTIPDPPQIPGSLDDQLRELNHVHGPSPATPEFGARRFDTGPPFADPLISTHDVDVPVYRPGFPIGSIEHVTVPVPDDVNIRYPIEQHTTAYSDPRTLAFRNLVSIAIGDRGEVVPAP